MKSWGEHQWRSFYGRATRITKVLVACAVLFMAFAHLEVWQASSERMHTRLSAVPARHVAIVLGALVRPSGELSHTVEDRIRCAHDLYRKGKVGRVLVSGDHGREHYDEVNAMADALVARGVRPEHVFLDHAGFRTLDTMHRAHEVFGVEDAVLCTQRFHLPRALYLAQSFGIDATGYVADRRRYANAKRDWLRERLAIVKALFDVTTGREARYLGPKHDIKGDGRSTRDQLSQK